MAPAADEDFMFFNVPRNDPIKLIKLAQYYRELRLTALRLSPEAFSSKLATEALFPEEYWKSRLQNHEFQTFICAVRNPGVQLDGDAMDEEDDRYQWIAQVTIRGPISAADYDLPEESGQPRLRPGASESEERWQILSLYMMPDYRGRGVSQRLCAETARWLRTTRLEPSSSLQAVRIRTMITPGNLASYSLFRKLGYVDQGLCTKAEGLFANGEDPPPNPDDPEYCTRAGHILVCTISR